MMQQQSNRDSSRAEDSVTWKRLLQLLAKAVAARIVREHDKNTERDK